MIKYDNLGCKFNVNMKNREKTSISAKCIVYSFCKKKLFFFDK